MYVNWHTQRANGHVVYPIGMLCVSIDKKTTNPLQPWKKRTLDYLSYKMKNGKINNLLEYLTATNMNELLYAFQSN